MSPEGIVGAPKITYKLYTRKGCNEDSYKLNLLGICAKRKERS